LGKVRILFVSPLAFLETRLKHFGPSLEALGVTAAGDHLGNSFPVAGAVFFNRCCELFIFQL
jgi:hypothetical protein